MQRPLKVSMTLDIKEGKASGVLRSRSCARGVCCSWRTRCLKIADMQVSVTAMR